MMPNCLPLSMSVGFCSLKGRRDMMSAGLLPTRQQLTINRPSSLADVRSITRAAYENSTTYVCDPTDIAPKFAPKPSLELKGSVMPGQLVTGCPFITLPVTSHHIPRRPTTTL